MSKIRGKDTKIELRLRKALYGRGLPYRLYSRKIPGHPDISCLKYRVAVFCDSEFWHGYLFEENIKKVKWNEEFWIRKIKRNIERDIEVDRKLKEMGFRVLRFWGRQIEKDLDTCVEEILKAYVKGGYKEKDPR